MLIGFLAWLELLLESGPLGPKPVPHRRPVKQTNKRTNKTDFSSDLRAEERKGLFVPKAKER